MVLINIYNLNFCLLIIINGKMEEENHKRKIKIMNTTNYYNLSSLTKQKYATDDKRN